MKTNIIFDIGNVIVKWQPFEVIKEVFPQTDAKEFFKKMYPVWQKLNLGQISIKEALTLYTGELEIKEEKIVDLLKKLQLHQVTFPESLALLQELQKNGYNLFSITDNIKEFVEFHRKNSEFFQYFKDVIVSADIGILKPDKRIFEHLLNKHNLLPETCIFIDDLDLNIEGAKTVGIEGILFTNAASCRSELQKFGVNVL